MTSTVTQWLFPAYAMDANCGMSSDCQVQLSKARSPFEPQPKGVSGHTMGPGLVRKR